MGVPDIRVTVYNFDDSIISAQIDTKDDMHTFNPQGTINVSAPPNNYSEEISQGANLVRSGLYTFNYTAGFTTVTVEQYWIRIGKILNVEFKASGNGTNFHLNTVKLPLPIGPTPLQTTSLDATGTFISDRRDTTDPLDIHTGILQLSQSPNFIGMILAGLSGSIISSTATCRDVVGSYMVEFE